jgi:hypothetical protein
VPYAAAKAGLAAATRSLRIEYAGTGVGFSVLIPDFVTGAGIFARHEAAGSTAPAIFGTVRPERVAEAVVRAVRWNRSESIITGRPIRPALALAGLVPGLMERLTSWVGITATAPGRRSRGPSRTVADRDSRRSPDGVPRSATTPGMTDDQESFVSLWPGAPSTTHKDEWQNVSTDQSDHRSIDLACRWVVLLPTRTNGMNQWLFGPG